ncbi:MAG: hypothetical protein WBV94_25115 [Blastocatellia bacterium]
MSNLIDPTTRKSLDHSFTYHAPTDDQVKRLQAINDASKALAEAILLNAPESADRTTAIRLVREARMWANASVVLEG